MDFNVYFVALLGDIIVVNNFDPQKFFGFTT